MQETREAARVPVLLVSGFLGSGKTTLINRFLRTPSGLRLGVLVNEFGQIGIDAHLLAGGGRDILELSDGCVCCASGSELWEAARALIERAGATHLIVETSGIAEPGVLVEQHRALPEPLRASFLISGVLCLVDVPHIREALARRKEARRQIEQADRILLTKLDLCRGNEGLAVHRLLDELGASSDRAALHPRAPEQEVKETLCWAFHPGGPRGARAPGRAHAHERQLSAVSWQEDVALWEGPLTRLLSEIPGRVLRAKGLVRLRDEDGGERLMVVQLAGGRLELAAASHAQEQAAPRGSTLVFLGEGLDEQWFRMRISACCARESALENH